MALALRQAFLIDHTRQAETGVQLVNRPIRRNSFGIFRDPGAANQSRGAIISGACVHACDANGHTVFSLWEPWPFRQGAQDDAIVGSIRLSVLPAVVYRGKIRCGHLLPKLLEARGIVALCPCSSQEKLPEAVQVYQGAWLILAYRLAETLPQRPHAPPLLHKRLQIDPTQEPRERVEPRHRPLQGWLGEGLQVK